MHLLRLDTYSIANRPNQAPTLSQLTHSQNNVVKGFTGLRQVFAGLLRQRRHLIYVNILCEIRSSHSPVVSISRTLVFCCCWFCFFLLKHIESDLYPISEAWSIDVPFCCYRDSTGQMWAVYTDMKLQIGFAYPYQSIPDCYDRLFMTDQKKYEFGQTHPTA